MIRKNWMKRKKQEFNEREEEIDPNGFNNLWDKEGVDILNKIFSNNLISSFHVNFRIFIDEIGVKTRDMVWDYRIASLFNEN